MRNTLWYSQVTRKIYQLGGWFSFNSREIPLYLNNTKIPESAIWQYDIDSGDWTETDFKLNAGSKKVWRPGAAANCDAPTLNRSYVFEGYIQQRSDQDVVNFTTSSEFQFLEGMLELNTKGVKQSDDSSKATLTNITVPTYMGPRMNGAMVHVPVGDKGVIVSLGGQVPNDATAFGVGVANANANNQNIGLDKVDIYDIETGYWFRQQTSGAPDIPTGRSDICTVMVPAQDGSSYNIFMIAGVETYNSVLTYEEWWVLTLPDLYMEESLYSR